MPQKAKLTGQRDREICDTLKPILCRDGLFFAGIDVIGDYLTEINVTSPTGIIVADTLEGRKGKDSPYCGAVLEETAGLAFFSFVKLQTIEVLVPMVWPLTFNCRLRRGVPAPQEIPDSMLRVKRVSGSAAPMRSFQPLFKGVRRNAA